MVRRRLASARFGPPRRPLRHAISGAPQLWASSCPFLARLRLPGDHRAERHLRRCRRPASSWSKSRMSATKPASFPPISRMAASSERGGATPAYPRRDVFSGAGAAAGSAADPFVHGNSTTTAGRDRHVPVRGSDRDGVRARERTRADDDPTIIRHLHDLGALEKHVASAPRFPELVSAAAAVDVGREAARWPGTRPRCSPSCCADWKRILNGRGSTTILCGRCRLRGPTRRLISTMRSQLALGSYTGFMVVRLAIDGSRKE
jgi:hypothetical protein